MSLSAIIDYVATTYGLDRAAALQVIIATAGVVLTASASFAALVSAWATARTVREMRAARLQQARPALRPDQFSRWRFTWDSTSNSFRFSADDGARSRHIGPTLRNSGFGTAYKAELVLGTEPLNARLDYDYHTLSRLFSAGDLKVVLANNGIEIRSAAVDATSTVRLLTVARESTSSLGSVNVGEEVVLDLNSFFLESFVASALSSFQNDAFAWSWPARLSYQSLTGEKYQEERVLALLRGPITYKIAAPIGQRDGIPHWSEISFEFTVILTNHPRPLSIRVEVRRRIKVMAVGVWRPVR